MQHKAIIILRALLSKEIITIKEHNYRYFARKDQFEVGEELKEVIEGGIFKEYGRYNLETKTSCKTWLPYEMSLGNFIEWCEGIPDEEVVLMSANKVLRDLNRKDRNLTLKG